LVDAVLDANDDCESRFVLLGEPNRRDKNSPSISWFSRGECEAFGTEKMPADEA